jgi:hypothetical protein
MFVFVIGHNFSRSEYYMKDGCINKYQTRRATSTSSSKKQ